MRLRRGRAGFVCRDYRARAATNLWLKTLLNDGDDTPPVRAKRSVVALPGELVAVDPAVVIGETQTRGGRFVDDDGRARVQLQRGAGANRAERALDHLLD